MGYTETEFRDFILDGEDLKGNEFPFAPNWTANIGGSYFFNNGYEIHLIGNFTDKFYELPTNDRSRETDSYFIVDARVGYQSDDWSLYAFARNLFDKEYIDSDNVDDVIGEPRILGVQFSHQLHSLNF